MAKNLEFANLTLTFGSAFVLADMLDQIVIPAFTDTLLERTFGVTTFFFHEVQPIVFGTAERQVHAIVGRFVKDTIVRREQFFDPETKTLQPDPRRLASAPSAMFVLLVENHKLLYLPETSYAPDLDSFRATLKSFLTRKYLAYIDTEYNLRRTELVGGNPVSKAYLKEMTPFPDLSIIPLSNEESLSEFVQQFGRLTTVKIELRSVNAEADNNPFFQKMRAIKEAVGAEKSTLTEYKKDGLDKDAVVAQLAVSASEGNAKVTFSGKTPDGEILRGTNKEFRLTTPLGNLPPDLAGKAGRAYDKYADLVEKESIIEGKPQSEEARKLSTNFWTKPNEEV